jgi:hypothetical protein
MNSKKQLIQGLALCALSLCAMDAMAARLINGTNEAINVVAYAQEYHYSETKTLNPGESWNFAYTNSLGDEIGVYVEKLQINNQWIDPHIEEQKTIATLKESNPSALRYRVYHIGPNRFQTPSFDTWVVKKITEGHYILEFQ